MNKILQDIALEKIKEAAENDADTLELSFLELGTLPDELWELKHLKKLVVRFNNLTSLSPNIKKLANLTSLDLTNNKISAFPNELWELKHLNELVISYNPLTEIPSEIWKRKDWQELGIRGFQLTTLPPEIAQFTNLNSLDLSENQFTILPLEITQLTNLNSLDLSNNQFTTLPLEITQLTKLNSLDLSNNQFTTLPLEVTQLTKLNSLELSNNQLTTLPLEITRLTDLNSLGLSENQFTTLPLEITRLINLNSLDLSDNQLTALPLEITRLTNLNSLDLSGNQLTTLPLEISRLTNLDSLDIHNNQLTILPSEISQLINLKELILYNNQLTPLPLVITQLTNLKSLDVDGNQLTALPPEISQLTNLNSLDLRNNEFTALPLEITQLINLNTLNLSDNELTMLPPEISQLINLDYLNVGDNQLNELPKEIAELRNLNSINLHGNPLEIAIPTRWLKNSRKYSQEILAYYKQMHEEGGRPLGEVRVLVVGEADAGKTKLLRALLYGEYGSQFKDTRDATEGIEISEMQGKDVNTRVWDFGGQEIMHATHRFFLSRGCVYVLVADATRDRDYNQTKIEYWLELIKLYGSNSPVILVASKSESFSLDINKNDLQEKYHNLTRGPALVTSAKSGKGIEDLRYSIFEQAKKLPSVNVTLPRSFISVKDKIEKIKDKKKSTVIEEDDYRNLCKKNNITDEDRQNTLLQLLHDMGVVLHYENDDRLSDFGILNPEWATTGVYKLVNNPKIKDSQGKFTLGGVKDLLQDEVAYPANMRRRIVDLMKKFELTYELPFSQDTYILPTALPANQPDLKDWDVNTMAFEYQYPILRVGVLHRFMVKKHELIHNEQIWYSGVVLANKENQALIKADFGKKKILIKVKGAEETRKDFLYLIRMEFESIHGEESMPDEFIYHPKYPDVHLSFNEMKVLAKTDKEHKTVYKGERLVINLRELLDGFITTEERRKDEEKEEEEAKRTGKASSLGKESQSGDTYITNNLNVQGNIEGGSNVAIGEGHQITKNLQNNFSTFPNELQSGLIKLMKLTEILLQEVKGPEHKEEIKDELEDLQKQAKKSSPIIGKVKISVEGLAKAAKNLNEVGKPVLELATTIIKLIDALPA